MAKMPTDPLDRFGQAVRLALLLGSPLALVRLRAEVLLETDHPFAPDDRDRLERIAVAPKDEDRGWLGQFDFIFAPPKREGRA